MMRVSEALLVPRHAYDDVGDLDVGSIFSAIGKGLKSVGKGIAAGARGVAKASSAVGGALRSVPLVGAGLSGAYSLTVGAPFQVAANVLSGQRIDKVVLGHLKSQLAAVRDVAPYVQTVLQFVPGVGQGVSGAIAAGLALASGAKITDALMAATRGALPGGPLAQSAFDVGMAAMQGKSIDAIALKALPLSDAQRNALQAGLAAAKGIAHGQRVDQALLDNAMKALPADAKKAIQIGMSLGHGQVLQAVKTASSLNAVQRAGGSVGKQVEQKTMNIIGKGGRNILGQVANALPAPSRRAPIAIVSNEVQRAVTTLKRNPALASLPVSQIAKVAGVSSSNVQQALRVSRPGLAWKPLSAAAAARVRQAAPYSSLRALTDTRGLSPDGVVYVVEKGDSPGKIAKLLTGAENKWPQLVAANPQKKTVNRGIGKEFATLYAGEKLFVPASWKVQAPAAPVGTSVPTPAVIVSDPARENTASVLQAKTLLVAWSKTDGAKVAGFSDYGMRAEDLSPAYGERDKFMAASFEQWSNAQRGTNLPTDGLLNEQLLGELRKWSEQKVAAPIPALPPAAELPQASAPTGVILSPQPSPSPPVVVMPTLPAVPAVSVSSVPVPVVVAPQAPIELPDMTIEASTPSGAVNASTAPPPKPKGGGGSLVAALAGAIGGGLVAGPLGAVVGGGAGFLLTEKS